MILRILFWLLGGLGIAYGSLIPFDFHPYTSADAIARFRETPWLTLSAASRADWIANLLLYAPWAYLGMSSLGLRLGNLTAALVVSILSVAWAIGIEFAQLYFPPRTVSLNDLAAEILGTLLGIAVWIGGHRSLTALARAAAGAGGHGALRAALVLYLLSYLVLALFPFDVVLSASEWSAKLHSDGVGWLMAPATCANTHRCLAKFIVESLATIPIGVLVGLTMAPGPGARVGRMSALIIGLLLGLLIEGGQLLVVSGISQGVSVLTRVLGVALGASLWSLWQRKQSMHYPDPHYLIRRLQRFSVLALIVYLALLYVLFDLPVGFGGWLPFTDAWQRIDTLHFIPFYYHYFTSEAVAFVNLMSNLGAYSLIGCFVWLWSVDLHRGFIPGRTIILGAVAGGLVSLFVQAARLFSAALRPDPTDVLIGATGAALAVVFCDWLWNLWIHANKRYGLPLKSGRSRFEHGFDISAYPSEKGWLGARIVQKRVASPVTQNEKTYVQARDGSSSSKAGWRWIARLTALLLYLLAFSLALSLPLFGSWVTVALIVYLGILSRYPSVWLLLLPSVLVVVNLTFWTGRFFFDEADVFVLATLASWLWHAAPRTHHVVAWDALKLAFGGLVLVYVLSLAFTLWPLPPLTTDAFSSYYSPYNALRVAKGLFWALLLWPALHSARTRGTPVRRLLGLGILIALTGASLVVSWERWAYPGLFNFDHQHRVAGSFASMHTGGAFIDAFLALSIPLILLLLQWRNAWRWGMAPLMAIALYTALVTYSRATYVALAVSALVFISLALVGRIRNRGSLRGGWIPLVTTCAIAVIVVSTVLQGTFIQSRFETVAEDFQTRLKHWHGAIDQMDTDIMTHLFGMGLGQFPATYFWRNQDRVIPTHYRFQERDGEHFLSVGLGDSMYLDQRLEFDPYQTYELTVRFRSDDPKGSPTIALCEKALLYSYRCGWYGLLAPMAGGWRTVTRQVTPGTPSKPWDLERSRVVSIVLSGKPTTIDIGLVSLRDTNGQELIRNGDFQTGLDHWFFTTDNHLPWHIKNLWISAYFETGWIGLLTLAWLMFIGLVHLTRKSIHGDHEAPIFLASLSGFLVVGFFDSPFDDSRLGLLFWLWFIVICDGTFTRENCGPDKKNSG